MTLIPPTSTKRKTETISLWLTGALVVLSAAGCSRSHYRRQADVDAYGLVGQLSTDPRWQLPGYTINVDPASRMYDPYDPDRPPMPPDDPTSHQLMHCVDCRRGYPHWHADGDTPHIENPYWLSCLPVNDENKLIVNADTAVRLALLHSPDYQEELEELYLSALDVSFERFVFDHQFFAGQSLTFTADGRDRSTSGGQSQSVLDLSTSPGGRWSMTKLYTTGAELVVGLANSLVWQFAGPDTYTANTLLDFSLVQPLLRGAGRDRVLERLTIAERALLANVRQMERFRRGFYVEIVTGDDAGQGPSRRGGFFGGSGLEGFTGVGGGGFGRVGGFSFGGFGAGGFGAGAGAEMAGGFLGLLQEQQGLRNQDATIASLRNSLAQLEAYYNAGRIDFLQVQQARQALFNAESQRLNATAGFQSQLDNFKRDLGLPPQLEMTIDESLLKPFDLIDSNLVPIQDQLTELQKSIGDVILDLIPAEDNVDARPLTWSPRFVQVLLALQDYLRQVSGIRQSLAEASVPQARQDIIRLREAIPRRRQQLQTMEQDSRGQQTRRPSDWRGVIQTAKNTGQHENISVCSANVDVSRAQGDRTSNQLSQRKPPVPTRTDYITPLPLVDAEHRMRSLAEKQKRVVTLCRHVRRGMRVVPVSNQVATSSGGAIMDAIDIDQLQQLPELLEAMLTELMTRLDETGAHLQTYEQAIVRLLEDGPRLEQNVLSQRLREEVVAPIPNEVTELSAQVLELLLVQARARTESVTLVPITLDPDEAIEIAKVNRRDWMNARANLVDAWRLIQFNANDLESDLDITFSGDISNLNDDPFGFRGSTGRLRVGVEFDAPITRLGERNNYRQALIEFQQARRSYYEFGDRIAQGLRETIRTINVNLLNFELRRAAVQVAIAQVELARLRLQEPPKPEVVAEFGATTARDLVSALSDLLDAQNFFLSVWVNYEVLRRVLDFDLGTMQLDLDGLWLDPGPIGVLAPSVEKLDAPEPQEDLEADFALDRRVARVFKDLPDSNRDWFPGKALSAELPLGVVEIHSRQNRSQVARNVSVDRESATPDSRLSRLPPVD